MFYQLPSYFKKYLLIDVQQNLLPETYVNLMAKFAMNLQTCKTDTSPKTVVDRSPNLANNIPKKTYRPTGFKEL